MIDNQVLGQNIDVPTDISYAIFIPPQKVRRNWFQDPFSLKINAAFLIAQSGGSGACGGSGEEFSATSAIPPHAEFTNFHTASDHYGNVVTHTRDDLKKLLP